MNRVYLDWNATAPLRPEAKAAMLAAMEIAGNPSSVHAEGRAAKGIVEAAREEVAALVGAKPSQVVFTSGATEANALALAGHRGAMAVLAVEHESALAIARRLEFAPEIVAVDPDGAAELASLPIVANGSGLFAAQFANSETGLIQPIATVAQQASAKGYSVHCDAVQAAGKVPIGFSALGLKSLAISAHKFGGPKGVGALIVADGTHVQPMLAGGGQEQRLRPGTENVIGIAGFGAAAVAAKRGLSSFSLTRRLRDRLEYGLRQIAADVVIVGEAANRLPNTTSVVTPGISAETLVIALDLAGFAVSAGSACSSGKVSKSHVLQAMGYGASAGSAIRVSTGWTSTRDEIDGFLAAFKAAVVRIRGAVAA